MRYLYSQSYETGTFLKVLRKYLLGYNYFKLLNLLIIFSFFWFVNYFTNNHTHSGIGETDSTHFSSCIYIFLLNLHSVLFYTTYFWMVYGEMYILYRF